MDEIKSIIDRLERQGKAIEKAIAALRELDGQDSPVITVASTPVAPVTESLPGRKGNISEDGRRRISEALKARWAAKRAAAASSKKRGLRKVA
jgi:hypothetical protein